MADTPRRPNRLDDDDREPMPVVPPPSTMTVDLERKMDACS